MRSFTNDDQVAFLSFLRVWIPKHGYEAQSLLLAWSEFKGVHTMGQDPKIGETTKELAKQLIERHRERTENS